MSLRSVEIGVGGMTCASCANRVQSALVELPGVQATVNYATGEALVEAPENVTDAQLVQAVERTGYTAALTGKAEEPFDHRDIQRRLSLCAALTVPIMLVSMIPALQFSNWKLLVALASLPVVLWSAWPMHRAALLNAKHRTLTMDSLVSLGISISFLWSSWVALTASDEMHSKISGWHQLFANDPSGTFFEVSCAITTLVLLGKSLEMRARIKSTESLKQLANLSPTSATIVQGQFNVVKKLADVQIGELISVVTGAQIPIDATVESGTGYVDASMLTGEAEPIAIGPGSAVIGGTLLIDGAIRARVTATGRDTVLSSISRLVHRAQMGKAKVTKLVDRVSAVFIPVVFILALATGASWQLINHDVAKSISVGISVLVIACPCALGLATPTAILVGTGTAAKFGILLRGPESLEASEKISTIYLDKTGTLTLGKLSVQDWFTTIDQAEFWQIVGSLESATSHPVAKSLSDEARSKVGNFAEASNVRTIAGRGVQAEVDGVPCSIGSVSWLGVPSGELAQIETDYGSRGLNTVVVYQDATAVGV
ncbi:MAG: cation-translocating P-type ATPase, partial [Actinomycetales bacterium]|nr:cation-translocating P-type ATPase [Actinomycetales bacterium]